MKPNDLAQLDRILAEWADWMSHEKVGRGYPSRAAGRAYGGSWGSCADWCERAWAQSARDRQIAAVLDETGGG